MQREQRVYVGTSNLSGHFRGKSFPVTDLPTRLQRGLGLAPTNIFLSAFGSNQMTTFGTQGKCFYFAIQILEYLFRSTAVLASIFSSATLKQRRVRPEDFALDKFYVALLIG